MRMMTVCWSALTRLRARGEEIANVAVLAAEWLHLGSVRALQQSVRQSFLAFCTARRKGVGQVCGGAAQKVVLPPGWLEEGSEEENDSVPLFRMTSVLEFLDEASCEG